MTQALKKLSNKSIAAIAEDLSLVQTTLNRQARNNEVAQSTLIAFCKHYQVSLIDLLLEAGSIDTPTARQWRGVQGLSAYSELELAEEVYNRELVKELTRTYTP